MGKWVSFSILLTGLVASGLPLAAVAAGDGADCMASATTQSAMTACAQSQFKQADAKLNARYSALKKALADQPARRASLQKAERAWLAYRDADCAFAAGAHAGGSMAPMVKLQCLADRTARRSHVLASEMPQH